jgi:hypothetical protein
VVENLSPRLLAWEWWTPGHLAPCAGASAEVLTVSANIETLAPRVTYNFASCPIKAQTEPNEE